MLYIGYIESAATIGMSVGAPVGSFLNAYLGYENQFYCLSGLFFFTMILCYIFLPNSLIKGSEVEEMGKRDEVSYKKILCNKVIVLSFIAVMLSEFCSASPDNYLSLAL